MREEEASIFDRWGWGTGKERVCSGQQRWRGVLQGPEGPVSQVHLPAGCQRRNGASPRAERRQRGQDPHKTYPHQHRRGRIKGVGHPDHSAARTRPAGQQPSSRHRGAGQLDLWDVWRQPRLSEAPRSGARQVSRPRLPRHARGQAAASTLPPPPPPLQQGGGHACGGSDRRRQGARHRPCRGHAAAARRLPGRGPGRRRAPRPRAASPCNSTSQTHKRSAACQRSSPNWDCRTSMCW